MLPQPLSYRPLAALVLLPGLAVAVDVLPTPSLTVDRYIRSSVRAFDTTVYPAGDSATLGWTGSTGACLVGTENQDFIDAGILRINYYRRLVGLPDVGEDTAASDKCRAAALIMDAQNDLSHFPPNTWACYTPTGYEAAGSSNIALTSGAFAPGQAVNGYIDDTGTGNTAAGHRRWIFYPPLANVGHGDTPQANALWVIESGSHTTIWGARPGSPAWVAWPYAGYFPAGRLPSSTRWSYSVNNGNFANATIRVKDDSGTTLTTSKETYQTGYGDNTLVWQVSGVTTAALGTTDRPYHVLLRDIAGVTGRTAVHYSVVLVDTSLSRVDEIRPSANVAATVATASEGGATGEFTVTLSSAAERDTWINYALGGSAGAADFTPSGAIKILAAETSGTLTITAAGDANAAEGSETVSITLDPGCAYTVGGSATATVTITDGPSVGGGSGGGTGSDSGGSGCGAGGATSLLLALGGLGFLRRRRR